MRLLKRGRRFARNRRGVTAITFALCLIPILMMSGFAIDFGLHLTYKKKVQHALDMAGLAAARHLSQDAGADLDTIKRLARSHFQSELGGADYISLNQVEVTRAGMRINLEVDGTMPTSIMHLAGVPTMSLFTESEAAYGVPTMAEVVLVLDTSESMGQADSLGNIPLDALQTSAENLVTTLTDPASEFDTKVAIVPFSARVNVGGTNRNEAWINVPDDYDVEVVDECRVSLEWMRENCTQYGERCTVDGQPALCTRWRCDPRKYQHAPRDDCTTETQRFRWFGCVNSRASTNHLSDAAYDADPIPGFLDINANSCASRMIGLTENQTQLTTAIGNFEARGQTYIPAGLIWGLRMLTDNDPFAAEKSITQFIREGGTKTIVLMSDGANARVPAEDTGLLEPAEADIDPAAHARANANTVAICDTIRNANVEVYTVAFRVSDPDTTALLEGCASSASRFFTADSTDQLEEVFETITKQLGRDVSISG
ncbi:MAG: pilus assembly protein TadG-related protein [Pseudomonadota bacterium]